MSYAAERDEIYAQVIAVSGIGKVFKSRKYTPNMKEFLEKYKTDENIINVAWITPAAEDESGSGVGSTEADNSLGIVEENSYWEIHLYRGYKDDTTNPSEYAFNTLVEKVKEKFRFLQDLNGNAFRSFPLQVATNDLYMLGDAVCHRAILRLRIQQRILHTS